MSSFSTTKSKPYKVGCDPEGFFTKNGKPYPAIGLIGGTKENPKPMGVGAVQEDNVMFEFNTPPAVNADSFSSYIEEMLGIIEEIAKKNECGTLIAPYAEFDYKYLEHPQAMTIGCDPDYDAWNMQPNQQLDYTILKNIRTASGHVHVGVPQPENSPIYKLQLIKALDVYLGVPSIILDTDKTRRRFYGKAGAYRPKPYGVEYRVLSNFWIKEARLRKWVFQQAIMAVNNVKTVDAWERRKEFSSASLINAINECDVKYAKGFVDHFGISLP